MAVTAKSFVPSLSGEAGTATGASHAETLNAQAGVITTESLTTAAGATETRTLTNSFIGLGSTVLVQVNAGTNTKLGVVAQVTPAAGSATIKLYNGNAAALDGTLKYSFLVL